MQISRTLFYKNHLNEINKYLNNNLSALHISSINSEKFEFNNDVDCLYIDPEVELIFKDLVSQNKKYDLIIITDIFEVSTDIYKFVKYFRDFLNTEGKVILTSINPKWNVVLKFFEFLKLKRKSHINSYIKPNKISNIFNSLNFEKLNSYNKQILPFSLFGIGKVINIIFELFMSIFNIGIKTYFIYQLKNVEIKKYSKSIVVPAKNEEGNLSELIKRIPHFTEPSEIIISCGPSKDKTFEKALEIQKTNKNKKIIVFEQSKNGKANAVWEAIEKSSYEVVAILDSDISVDPEELINFFDVIENTNCDFVNGTRLMYPMEKSAMRYVNKFGNRSFQYLISKIIGVNLSDTLCGTKVFKKTNLLSLYSWQNKLKISDPFGDFDLIFSHAYSGSKFLEYPVHYRSRKYGKTNISRFKDGWKLILYLSNSLVLFKTSKY